MIIVPIGIDVSSADAGEQVRRIAHSQQVGLVTMSFGVDYAWGRPSVTSLKNAGVTFACRYLSHDTTGKNLTHAEAVSLSNAGIWLVVVWETTAQRALDGHAAGVQDAKDADAQAKACGMPSGRPIYFAVDFDATSGQQSAINAYFDGVASVLGKARTGIYAGYNPVKRTLDGGHAAWAWQTYAWSGGKWDSRAQLQQYSNDHVIGGVGLDYDRSTKTDYGQWKVGVTPTPPTPTEEDDMPTGLLSDGSKAITPISLPKGRYKTIGFIADNGLQGLPPAQLRVAIHQGGGSWHTEQVSVDSHKGQTVVHFPDVANTDGISVRREDAGDVHIAYEVS